ncbi:MAG: DinB family protein [Candidatus Eisenbacteria bacterium]|nr:DinB family protein [Candidatus Latescibacterota bacterium]MBD3303133.1 DinB family protein [Candidatus Eisenbacteria bacterium]
MPGSGGVDRTLEWLAMQFELCGFAFGRNLDGVTEEEALTAPPGGGNCLNWIAGHILASRNGVLRGLGAEPVWEERESKRYGRGAAPITSAQEAVPLSKILPLYEVAQDRIRTGLRSFDPDRLADPAPFSPIGRDDETIGSLIASFAFHEAYHTGQTGSVRRALGKPGGLQ